MTRLIPLIIVILGGSALADATPPQIAGVKPVVLVADDINAFKSFSANPAHSKHEIVPVEGQPFSSAVRLSAIVRGTNHWIVKLADSVTFDFPAGLHAGQPKIQTLAH